MRTPTDILLNAVRHRQYHELCELLGGWRDESWCDLVFGDGEPYVGNIDGVTLNGKNVGYHLVRRVTFDLDWKTYVLAQVWDYQSARPTWEFVLFFNWAQNNWVPEQQWSWGSCCPSYAEVGAVVDMLEYERIQ